MANIITMNNKQLAKASKKKLINTDKCYFIIVSDYIYTTGEEENLTLVNNLLPSETVFEYLQRGKMKRYRREYLEWLNVPGNERFLTHAVKIATEKDVVILTDEREEKYGVLEIIAEYMENIYAVKVHTWKEFKKYNSEEQYGSISRETIEILKQKYKDIIPLMAVQESKKAKRLKKEEKKAKKAEKKAKKEKKKAKKHKDDEYWLDVQNNFYLYKDEIMEMFIREHGGADDPDTYNFLIDSEDMDWDRAEEIMDAQEAILSEPRKSLLYEAKIRGIKIKGKKKIKDASKKEIAKALLYFIFDL